MIRKLLVLSVLVVFMGVTSTAGAHTMSSAEKHQVLKTYYHANGYIKTIWKNARRTVYNPNLSKRNKWWAALKFLTLQRDKAWQKLHPKPHTVIPANLLNAFTCIHRFEGAWNANTGNGYYGGLQMDIGFQSTYGSDFMSKWGTADNWPIWAQLQAAARAYSSGRGFNPWPNTARACGLI